jgi:hypothetical protein
VKSDNFLGEGPSPGLITGLQGYKLQNPVSQSQRNFVKNFSSLSVRASEKKTRSGQAENKWRDGMDEETDAQLNDFSGAYIWKKIAPKYKLIICLKENITISKTF